MHAITAAQPEGDRVDAFVSMREGMNRNRLTHWLEAVVHQLFL
jgi:hypothetical protein